MTDLIQTMSTQHPTDFNSAECRQLLYCREQLVVEISDKATSRLSHVDININEI